MDKKFSNIVTTILPVQKHITSKISILSDIFESLLKLFVKKDVAYHFPRRTMHLLF